MPDLTVLQVLNRAREVDLKLWAESGTVAYAPSDHCPPEMERAIIRLKTELLEFLVARTHRLPADCRPWLDVANRVLAGEFCRADRSTLQSLEIGLRSIPHGACEAAVGIVRTQLKSLQ